MFGGHVGEGESSSGFHRSAPNFGGGSRIIRTRSLRWRRVRSLMVQFNVSFGGGISASLVIVTFVGGLSGVLCL